MRVKISSSVALSASGGAGEKQGHQRVQQPVVQQKRFDRSKQRRRVIAQPPRRPNQKRARETGQIQRPPRLKPRHRRHARVQQREIGKQHHILPAAVRHQQRRGQTADQRGLRHRLRILFHRHRRRSRHQSRHRRKHHRRRQQRMQLQSRQRGEVHHRHAEAFEHQAVLAAAALQLPARKRGGQTRLRHCQITQPHRNLHPLRSVAQQKGQAEKQHHHARFQQRIAAHKPRPKRVSGILRRGGHVFRRPARGRGRLKTALPILLRGSIRSARLRLGGRLKTLRNSGFGGCGKIRAVRQRSRFTRRRRGRLKILLQTLLRGSIRPACLRLGGRLKTLLRRCGKGFGNVIPACLRQSRVFPRRPQPRQCRLRRGLRRVRPGGGGLGRIARRHGGGRVQRLRRRGIRLRHGPQTFQPRHPPPQIVHLAAQRVRLIPPAPPLRFKQPGRRPQSRAGQQPRRNVANQQTNQRGRAKQDVFHTILPQEQSAADCKRQTAARQKAV